MRAQEVGEQLCLAPELLERPNRGVPLSADVARAHTLAVWCRSDDRLAFNGASPPRLGWSGPAAQRALAGPVCSFGAAWPQAGTWTCGGARSEEHTSELQ